MTFFTSVLALLKRLAPVCLFCDWAWLEDACRVNDFVTSVLGRGVQTLVIGDT